MRFLACALLVIAATCATDAKSIANAEVGSRKTCVPGKSFAYYCNDCVCRADGLVANARCTRMYCEPGEWNEDGTENSPAKELTPSTEATRVDNTDNRKRCTPGGSFPFYCNTCACGDDGKVENAACTWMHCDDAWNRDGTLKISEVQAAKDEEKCPPGRMFANYCVTCLCGLDGLAEYAICPFKPCDQDAYYKNGTLKSLDEVDSVDISDNNKDRCVPGESFPYYCNTCSCGDDGLAENAACTWMRCDNDWNKDGTRKEICEPGKSFKDYCNDCICGPDGLAENARCEKKVCDVNVWNKDGTRKVPTEVNVSRIKPAKPDDTCVVGTTFKYYCDDCFCLDGTRTNALCMYSCDRRGWNEDGTKKNLKPEDLCEPATNFKYYCNDCFCKYDGLKANADCTRKLCDHDEWNEDGTMKNLKPEETCVPGSSFKYYCNDYFCKYDGLKANADCTRKLCVRDVWNEDGTMKNLKPEENCVPGSSFNDYCNTCYCKYDGLKANADCTRMLCDHNEWYENGTRKYPESEYPNWNSDYVDDPDKPFSLNPVKFDTKRNEDGTMKNPKLEENCVPGSSFSDYCNTCYCKYDGLKANADCTRMLCDHNEWYENGTRKYPESEYPNWNSDYVDDPDKPFSLDPVSLGTKRNRDGTMKNPKPEETCVPGSSFNDYCNTCYCKYDGLKANADCTRMLCDHNEWNENGTRKYPESEYPNWNSDYVDDPDKPFSLDPVKFGTKRNEDGTMKNPKPEENCVPGSSFSDYCNTCYCKYDGLKANADCTRMLCDHNEWNEDGTRKYPESEYSNWNSDYVDDPDKPFSLDPVSFGTKRNRDGTMKNPKPEETCVPGSSFKDYCNNCYCKYDGLKANADCTRMLCDHNEWNEDGTRKYPESDYSNWNSDYVDDPDKPFSLNPVSFGRRN